MKSRVLMLDVDGVLNSLVYWRTRKAEAHERYRGQMQGLASVDDVPLRLLDAFLRRLGAVVVLSSSWRYLYSPEKMYELFHMRSGWTVPIVGATPSGPDDDHPRGRTIAKWVREHPVRSLAIVDDDDDMAELRPFLVQTSFDEGLTEAHLPALEELLTREL